MGEKKGYVIHDQGSPDSEGDNNSQPPCDVIFLWSRLF
jgi:hypothetical protein